MPKIYIDPPLSQLSTLMNLYWDLQKTRIAAANRIRMIEDSGDLSMILGEVEHLEKEIDKRLKKCAQNHPLWSYWLKNITGIGEVLAAQLIHLITGKKHTAECMEKREEYFSKKKPGEKRAPKFECDCPIMEIERFHSVSALHKYAGMHVVDGKAPRMRKGQKVNWNPKLRSVCYNVGKSFVMNRSSPYRPHYDRFKAEEKQKHPELSKGHIDARARRKTVKLFLAHLFDQWYRLKGLDPPRPYPMSVLQHENYIPPPR